MEWISELSYRNFLGIYDVLLDIETEINISPDRIVIPLFQKFIRFPQLIPVDCKGMRDDYCELRWKALNFLKDKGVVRHFTLLEGAHRWENKVRIFVEGGRFEETLNKMHKRYKKWSKMKENAQSKDRASFWDLLHPKIVEVAKSRFDSKHFADSVEAALKEVSSVVKGLVKAHTGQEFDGANLMNRAFSLETPVIKLSDLSSDSAKDIQKGYLQIFAGTMTGIRNPKAHQNISIDNIRAIHFLFLASLLMSVVDERE